MRLENSKKRRLLLSLPVRDFLALAEHREKTDESERRLMEVKDVSCLCK